MWQDFLLTLVKNEGAYAEVFMVCDGGGWKYILYISNIYYVHLYNRLLIA
jgi:hypothetical protein